MAKPENPPLAILPGQQALKNRIILLFAKQAVWTAQDIHVALSAKGKSSTLQAVYLELRNLAAEGIVQKIGKNYALNSPWILQLQSFAAKLATASFAAQAGIAVLSGQVKRQSWKFDNLLAMNELWGHILVQLTRYAQRKVKLNWLPHLWFDLFQWEQEDRFLRSYRFGGNRVYYIIGADCFLNRYATKLLDKHEVVYSFAPGPFRAQMDSYIIVIDDYVVTVRLAKAVAQRLDDLLRPVRSLAGFVASDLAGFFVRDSPCTLTVEKNERKANELVRRFGDYFSEDFFEF